jgi:DNA-binding CsgD family transcriptional regulator
MELHNFLRSIEELCDSAFIGRDDRSRNGEGSADELLEQQSISHTQRAHVVHAKLLRLTQLQFAATSVIELYGAPVFVTDVELRVQLANRQAFELRPGDGLTIDRDVVHAGSGESTRLLRCHVSLSLKDNVRRVMPVQRSEGRRSACVSITPIAVQPRSEPHTLPLVAIAMGTPDAVLRIDQKALRELYGLTRAEAHLAALLAADRTIEEAAIELSVSQATIRTHLQRIFMKTDTTRQAQLLRLLLLGPGLTI